MKTHIIEQTDEEGNQYNWIAIDEETARELWENDLTTLFYVREDAEGIIEDEEDFESAVRNWAVCIEDSYLWRKEYEEGAQNRFRNNDKTTFDEWIETKIENLKNG